MKNVFLLGFFPEGNELLFDRFIFPGYKKSRCSKLKGLFYSYSSLLFVCLLQISCLVNITAVNNLTRKSPCIVFREIELPAEHWRNAMSFLLHCTHVPPRRPRMYLFSSHTKPDLFSFLIFARLLLHTANRLVAYPLSVSPNMTGPNHIFLTTVSGWTCLVMFPLWSVTQLSTGFPVTSFLSVSGRLKNCLKKFSLHSDGVLSCWRSKLNIQYGHTYKKAVLFKPFLFSCFCFCSISACFFLAHFVNLI